MEEKAALRIATELGDMFGSPAGVMFESWVLDQVNECMTRLGDEPDHMEIARLTGEIRFAKKLLQIKDRQIDIGRKAYEQLKKRQEERSTRMADREAPREFQGQFHRDAI